MRWRNTAVNTVRNIGIMLALAVLSFVIGFFGLAKLLPANQTPTKQSAQVAANNVAQSPVGVTSSDTTVKSKTPPPSSPIVQPKTQSIAQPVLGSAVPSRTAASNRGPVLDATDEGNGNSGAASDTQKARTLDSETPVTQSGSINQPGGVEQTPKRRRHKKRTLTPPSETVPS